MSGKLRNCFFTAPLLILTFHILEITTQEEDTFAFDTWKFSDYADYDVVKWGTQRGVCPELRGYCGRRPEGEDGSPVSTPLQPSREECEERERHYTELQHNVLWKNVFCGVSCETATECQAEENCCEDPCKKKICMKVTSDAGAPIIPAESRKCPELLEQCQKSFKCLRPDQFCNGVDDCGEDDDTDENEENCKRQYLPVFMYGIQNDSSKISIGTTNLLILAIASLLLSTM